MTTIAPTHALRQIRDARTFTEKYKHHSTSAIPPEMAKQFADDAGLPSPDVAKLTAEAITAVIEADHEIVPKAELALRLRTIPVQPEHRHRETHGRRWAAPTARTQAPDLRLCTRGGAPSGRPEPPLGAAAVCVSPRG